MRERVLSLNADVGIALDGDGDRVVMVDAKGNVVDGDQLIYVIAKDRHQRGLLHGGVVGTLMSNYGLEKAMALLGVPFVRTRVGDRYVLEALREHDWKIGGESSGHVVCLDKTTTGDGIVAALQILAIMVKQEKSLEDLCAGITLLPQTLLNLKTEKAMLLAKNPQVLDAVSALDARLQGEGRVLLRPSGTEPMLRVMVEGLNPKIVELQAQQLMDDIRVIEGQL